MGKCEHISKTALENGIKQKLMLVLKNFETHAYHESSKSSWKIHIMKKKKKTMHGLQDCTK